MKPNELKNGDKVFFIYWNPYLFTYEISIVEITGIGEYTFYNNHTCLDFNIVLGDCYFTHYELYNNYDLNYIYCEIFDWDDCAFITCNEQLFTELLKQLIENKRYDPILIRRVLYYD